MTKYKGIDGLKAITILIIVLIHVTFNGNYNIDSHYYNSFIYHIRICVEIFFILSAFGMCCGYYEKFKNKEIDLNYFYKKRIIKIWPYFALLIIADLATSGFTKKNLIESFLDGTLFMGFLPNNHIEIAGIGWTLGVIFAFYFLFPFFVFITWTKLRAWISLAVFMAIRLIGFDYLAVGGKAINGNFLTWFYLFIVGGLIFLYKDDLERIFKKREYLLAILFVLLFAGEIILYKNGFKETTNNMIILSFVVIIVYCLVERVPILGNKFFVFLGSLCLQIYLFHMAIFRLVSKIGLAHIFKNEVASLVVAYVLTFAITLGVSYLITKLFNYKKWNKNS